ncbi:MAG: LUD domain-containing protein, partial [Alphaproteobacteria bacterium]|nr:LUD domain-containing protein [Alphaproteobacteria bacterium]
MTGTASDSSAHAFAANAAAALADQTLRQALSRTGESFVGARARAVADLPEFEALRDAGGEIKDHVLANLDLYLERYAARAEQTGAVVHWARDAQEARDAILGICRAAGARTVNKGKSMVTEEIGLNAHLAANGVTPVETDLGEYIIQLRDERPSHIIAPAMHLNKSQIADTFRDAHKELDANRPLDDAQALL